jgi:predicted permease
MSWWRPWDRREADLEAELLAHLEMATRDRIDRGEDPVDARRAARREFGNVASIKDAAREMRRWRLVEHAVQDVRHSVRLLRRNPGMALAAAICIGCGIGVSTTIFGAVNALLIRPLPYPDAQALVVVHSRNVERKVVRGPVAWPDAVAWRDDARVFAEIGVWSPMQVELTAANGEVERLVGASISAGVLRALRHTPMLGRNFEAADQQFGNHRKVLLSHGLWQRRYGGDPAIVGRTIDLAARPAPTQSYLVIGVLPPAVSFPEGAELWVPADIDIDEYPINGSRHYSAALARLAPGATIRDANASVATIARRLQQEFPRAQTGWDARIVALRDELVGDLRPALLLFQGAAVLVLLIGCANVANLTLARGVSRGREIAIRIAIGAGRVRLLRHLMTESVMLAMLGGALGVLGAYWGVKLLSISFPDGVPEYIDFSVDRTVLAFTTVLSVVTGLVFGIVPALRATRVAPAGMLQERNLWAGAGVGSGRTRNALVAFEIAVSLVLMIGAMLLIRSDVAIRSTLGFDPRGVLSIGVPTPPQQYEGQRREVFYPELAERIRALPNVLAVGWAGAGAPLERPFRRTPIEIIGGAETHSDAASKPEALVHEIGPTYFDAMGVPIVRGRGISAVDRPPPGRVSQLAAVVNEAFVVTFLPRRDPVGQRVLAGIPGAGNLGTVTFTIVGVVRDFRQEAPPRSIGPAMYVYAPLGTNSQTLTVRTTLDDALSLVPDVRAIVQQMDPSLAPPIVRTFEDTIARSLWRERLYERVLGWFAFLAMLLAVFGVYAVIMYAVAQRTREFGVRLALGATKAQVLVLALRQAALLAVVGVAIGVVAALQLTTMLSSVLHDVHPTDPTTFISVSMGLVLAVVLAALTPARRASNVDPVVTLRVDG